MGSIFKSAEAEYLETKAKSEQRRQQNEIKGRQYIAVIANLLRHEHEFVKARHSNSKVEANELQCTLSIATSSSRDAHSKFSAWFDASQEQMELTAVVPPAKFDRTWTIGVKDYKGTEAEELLREFALAYAGFVHG